MSSRRTAAAPLQAYVLHQYAWSESSLILDLFTRERGRIAVAAKGAKRPYSQLRVVLLPFQRLHISLGRSAGDDGAEVQTLRSAEWAGGMPMPSGGALFPGFYLNELLLRLLARQDPHAALFDAYASVLPYLSQADDAVAQAALRAFELTLLREVGVLPELNCVTLTQQPVHADASYTLRAEVGVAGSGLGAVAGARAGSMASAATGAHAASFTGAQLVALQAALEHGSADALRSVCAGVLPVLRGSLRALLHYHLGMPGLRTRQVMADMRKLLDPPPPRPLPFATPRP